ncbi:protein FAR1-RELATED SEQUENCE 5-like [Arachis stenosperma]|uniref:protein FAR1-RELATED SEQUENCE 5-like n=1 Tax=Arachis stenosperma TaxID=217475 RepID=UPI0025AD60E1|nr:protein FAR1-RELATED SEQUENCE 5-like [Arachis stenosperma]
MGRTTSFPYFWKSSKSSKSTYHLPRAETRCGCPARMLLRMDDESRRWPSEDERSGHRADERHAQRGHWHLANPRFYGEPSRRYHNVPYITRDMHNVNAKQRREGGLDAELCLNTGQIDYQVFGDVVTFDAMYKKNVYLSPLVVFSDVNHHNQTVVFAAALVADEKEETYVWLLQQLQTSMKGKAPVSIIADDDRDCMLGDYEVRTFQRKWFEIVEKFGIADKRWVQDMYERSYTDFLRHFHRCLMFVCAKEVEANFECAKGDPVKTTNLKQLERSAAENYTQVIFYLFVPILDRALVDFEDNVSYFIHIISRYGTPGKDWHVVATSDMSEVRCTSMKIECFGVPCEHIIAVLVLNNVHEIPRSLILPKWTKDAKLVAVQSMVCKRHCHADAEALRERRCRDTNFPHEGPPTEGGRAPARNPPKRNTKGNGVNGGKKTQRCCLCGEVGHNRTTCPHRHTMESSSAVADDLDSMDIDMLYDNIFWDLYAITEIPSFRCSDSDMPAGFVNSDFAGTNTSGPLMSLAD